MWPAVVTSTTPASASVRVGGQRRAAKKTTPHPEQHDALQRISPLRSRWPEVVAFDQRAAELDQRAAAASEELRVVMEERNAAPDADARALVEWYADGERGTRPDPTGPELDRRIAELERERDGLRAAADGVLAEKAAYVEKHRARLVKDADKYVAKLRESFEQRIDELARMRPELIEARSAAVWARTFPDRSAGATPPATMAGGVRRVLERAGIAGQVEAERIFELLREDARFLERALTQEQATALGAKPDGEAIWLATDEGRRVEREHKAKARARFKREWGHEIS